MKKKHNIPLLDLKREYQRLQKPIAKALTDACKAQQWVLGPAVIQLEKAIARYMGSKHAVGVASGTDALVLALRALALVRKGRASFHKREEIITTPFTFVATAEAIVRCGATPVFVDIDPATYNLDPEAVKKTVTKNTVGIIPVHLFGLPADMTALRRIARKHKLFILEDTAQGAGASVNGKKAGSIGDCGALSFFPSKNLGGYGDGGMVVTNSARVAKAVRVLRHHGQTAQYNATMIGYNSRLDSIQAAVVLEKLRYLNQFNAKRRSIAGQYSRGFKKISHIHVPVHPKGYTHIFHLYTIRIPADLRDAFVTYLNKKGIAARVYYPVLLSSMRAFKGNSRVARRLKNACQATKEVVTLPLYPFLRKGEIAFVIKMVTAFFAQG